ncbi:MAG: DUF1565 domain-containing protein, partial [Gammaproteobacteria bacterium]|nr:DUF1565 domain-containing protein [Gammaproteobacteria bacterium]
MKYIFSSLIPILLILVTACGGGGGSASTSSDSENSSPIAVAGDDQLVLIGNEALLDGSLSSDPDNDQLSYSWQTTIRPDASAGGSYSASSAVNTSFVPDVAGSYQVTLTVSDGTTESSDVVMIFVGTSEQNISKAGADIDAQPGTVVSLDGSQSVGSVPDTSLSYTWRQIAGPDVLNGEESLTGVSPSFTAPAEVSTVLFELIISDIWGVGIPDLVQVNVMEEVNGGMANAIFVAKTGNDANQGTRSSPLLTIQEAINQASNGKDVYIASGAYDESLTLKNGVSLYGGYRAADWFRDRAVNTTLIQGGNRAVYGVNVSTFTLDGLTITSADGVSDGESSTGLLLSFANNITISNNHITAGNGANGNDGDDGVACIVSNDGSDATDMLGAAGGNGSESPGGSGGRGGDGGVGNFNGDTGIRGYQSADGMLGGYGGGGWGGNGSVGHTGGYGADGFGGPSLGGFNTAGYQRGDGEHGIRGDSGGGGGGGGGGRGGTFQESYCYWGSCCDLFCYTCYRCDGVRTVNSVGGGGGGGGCGGAGGNPGT